MIPKSIFQFSMAALLLTCGPILAQSLQRSVPLEFTSQGTILVQGILGDTLKARFVLDTGAGCHVISYRALRKLQASELGRYVNFQADGTRQDRPMYEIPALGVGPAVQVAPAVAVWDMLDSSGVDGILSAAFFRNRVVTLDFTAREMVFEDSLSLLKRLEEGEIVPVKTQDDRGRGLLVFFDVSAPVDHILECLFDTGAGTTLDERYLKLLKVIKPQQWVGIGEKGERQFAWSGSLEYIALTFANGVGLDDAPVGFVPNMLYDGRIGWNFFTGRVLTFNLPEQYVIIKKQ
ncbi:aspartyl protease family protein [bacterium]|nr:aspartyl protease family protein [bacterium]